MIKGQDKENARRREERARRNFPDETAEQDARAAARAARERERVALNAAVAGPEDRLTAKYHDDRRAAVRGFVIEHFVETLVEASVAEIARATGVRLAVVETILGNGVPGLAGTIARDAFGPSREELARMVNDLRIVDEADARSGS